MATLDELNPNQKAVILKLNCERRLRRRLLDMGFVKGTEIHMKKMAPLADPVEYVIKGYNISLRKKDARFIDVKYMRE